MKIMKIISAFLALAITVNCMAQTDTMKKFKKSTIKLDKIPYDIYKGTIQVRLKRSDSTSGYIFLPVYGCHN